MTLRRADDTAYTLAINASATGNAVAVRGGEYVVFFDGNPGGATISLQIQSPNGTWIDASVFTNSIIKYTNLPASQTGIDLPACNVRMAATGGSPTGIYAYLVGLG